MVAYKMLKNGEILGQRLLFSKKINGEKFKFVQPHEMGWNYYISPNKIICVYANGEVDEISDLEFLMRQPRKMYKESTLSALKDNGMRTVYNEEYIYSTFDGEFMGISKGYDIMPA